MTVLTNQPENLNRFYSTSWELKIGKLPHVSFFCQRVSLPNLILGGPVFSPSRFMDTAIEGDKLTSDLLNLSVMLDEDFKNYKEIYDWMIGLGFPESHDQFTNLRETGTKSDIQVFGLDNNHNPNVVITFKDANPVTLGTLDFDSASDNQPLIYEVGFQFTGTYTIEKL